MTDQNGKATTYAYDDILWFDEHMCSNINNGDIVPASGAGCGCVLQKISNE